jgi:hypothetical protein
VCVCVLVCKRERERERERERDLEGGTSARAARVPAPLAETCMRVTPSIVLDAPFLLLVYVYIVIIYIYTDDTFKD